MVKPQGEAPRSFGIRPKRPPCREPRSIHLQGWLHRHLNLQPGGVATHTSPAADWPCAQHVSFAL